MFISCNEREGTAYYEFQYCKKEWPIKKLLKRGYKFWREDSLLFGVEDIEDEEDFFLYYGSYLEPTYSPDGTNVFCFFGINYNTKELAKNILEKIKQDKPPHYEKLANWLEKAISQYNGFFLLGI